ncbi:hypothetical protein AN189_18020 [Loktanella sp. 3ANDIMAR09]|nr:hypothetical protein AN189_18020 [Loktanella sp. 3ANDIMAR09]
MSIKFRTPARFIVDIAQDGRSGQVVQQRPNEQNPRSGRCPMHLRRICGVCARFDGDTMRSRGRCAEYGAPVSGAQSAADCTFWARKNAVAGSKS